MSFLSGIFDWIGRVLRKIFDVIKKILPYVLLGIAIWLALGLPFAIPALGILIEGTLGNALLVAGASFLFAPGETTELIGGALDAVGDAAVDVVETVVEVAGGAAGAVLGSPLVLAGLAFAAWWFFLRDDDKKKGVVIIRDPKDPQPLPEPDSPPLLPAPDAAGA
jgi:hypothetical protein